MAKRTVNSTNLEDEAVKRILTALLMEFRERGLGTEDLHNTYDGLSPAELKSTCCAVGQVSEVDFDLAMEDLDRDDLVKTGPMVPYENDPNSGLFIMMLFSKNEYAYLTEKGYKAATRVILPKPSRAAAAPRVHISGGTFHQSPIGIVGRVTQDNSTNISSVSNDSLFVQIHEKALSITDEAERDDILARIDELQRAQGSSGFLQAYQKFVASASNHMTLFLPLLPLLTQMLSSNQ